MNEISRLQPPASTRVDDFLKRGEEVYNEQRSRVLALEAGLPEDGAPRSSPIYARRVSDLAHEGAEALRRLDARASAGDRGRRGQASCYPQAARVTSAGHARGGEARLRWRGAGTRPGARQAPKPQEYVRAYRAGGDRPA